MNREFIPALRCCHLPQPPLFLLCRPNYMHMFPAAALPEHFLPWASRLRVMDTMTSVQSPTAELGFAPKFDVLQFLIL